MTRGKKTFVLGIAACPSPLTFAVCLFFFVFFGDKTSSGKTGRLGGRAPLPGRVPPEPDVPHAHGARQGG